MGAGGARHMVSAMPRAFGNIFAGRFLGMRFGSAAAHEDYPEGGLRVSGCLDGHDLIITTTYSGVVETSAHASMLITPNRAYASGLTTANALFYGGGGLDYLSGYFRQFRFRSLELEYTSRTGIGANTDIAASQIQLSCEKDPYTASIIDYSGAYNFHTAVTNNTVRFPAWTPNYSFVAIKPERESRDDQLYFSSGLGANVQTTTAGDIRLAAQGAILAVRDTNAALSGSQVLGHTMVHFVIDLYGWAPGTMAQYALSGASREAKGDSKDCESQPAQPLPSLTPPTQGPVKEPVMPGGAPLGLSRSDDYVLLRPAQLRRT
jgi:hypothetical protein